MRVQIGFDLSANGVGNFFTLLNPMSLLGHLRRRLLRAAR